MLAHLAPRAAACGERSDCEAIRVRGALRTLSTTAFADKAPHPDPLPVRTGRGRRCAQAVRPRRDGLVVSPCLSLLYSPDDPFLPHRIRWHARLAAVGIRARCDDCGAARHRPG